MTADWSDDAACAGKPYALFYGAPAEPFDPAPALDICRRCDAIDQCRAYAIAHGDIDADGRAVHGVIAGVAPPTKSNGRQAPVARLPRVCALPSCNERFTQTPGRPGGLRFYCCREHAAEARRLYKSAQYHNRKKVG